MKQKRTSRAEWEKVFGEIPSIPKDDPIYSEGPSITFSSRTQKPSEQKAIVSPQTDSESGSD